MRRQKERVPRLKRTKLVALKNKNKILKPFKRRSVKPGAVMPFDVPPVVTPFAVPLTVVPRVGDGVAVRRPFGLPVKRQSGLRPVLPLTPLHPPILLVVAPVRVTGFRLLAPMP